MKTDFTQIIFDPTNHSYTYHGRPLISVTRRLSQLKKPFDREPWARREAEKHGGHVVYTALDLRQPLLNWLIPSPAAGEG
ncbi:MAG: hypothetical protein L6R45_29635 [Anaerolineae bacterium]|nr:hypothetical protein [Anaerolineae bacterium]